MKIKLTPSGSGDIASGVFGLHLSVAGSGDTISPGAFVFLTKISFTLLVVGKLNAFSQFGNYVSAYGFLNSIVFGLGYTIFLIIGGISFGRND